jgi:hypothetical protein
MGNLLGRKGFPEVPIDFEGDSKPSDGEQKVWNEMNNVLERGPDALSKIEEYKGCQDLARKAMSNATYENELEAFEGLLYAVDAIAAFFDFSRDLEKVIPPLLLQLSTFNANEAENKDKVTDQQALAHQLAQILDFTLQFDQTRMMRPHLSNDFSYYRRLLPKFNKHPNVKVKDDEASGMALFTAEHIPMMTCLAKATQRAMEKNEHVALCLAIMANSCMRMVRNKRFAKRETNLFCLRAMAGSIVLYDLVHHLGAFHKKAPIALKQCVLLLKKDYPEEVSLVNAIRFSSKNFKDAPESIVALFD